MKKNSEFNIKEENYNFKAVSQNIYGVYDFTEIGLTNYLIHDLATPLSSIMAVFKLLESRQSTKEDLEILDAGKASIQSAVEILASAKEIKNKKLKLSKFNIYDSLIKVGKIYHTELSKNRINMLIECNKEFKIKAFQTLFNRMLLNIIKNSIEELKLSKKSKKIIAIKAFKVNGNFIISIKDNGRGILEKDIKQITRSGFTKKTNHQGLGLSFVNELMKNNFNGELKIKSVLNEFTEIELVFKNSAC